MFSRNIFQVIKTKGRIRNHGFRSKSSYTKENLTSTILSNIKNLKSKKWAFGLSGLVRILNLINIFVNSLILLLLTGLKCSFAISQ